MCLTYKNLGFKLGFTGNDADNNKIIMEFIMNSFKKNNPTQFAKDRRAIEHYYDLVKNDTKCRVLLRDYINFFRQYRITDFLTLKETIFNRYKNNSEYGYTVIVEEGMDCDGVQYRYVGEQIKCVPIAIDKEIDRIRYSADGSVSVNCVKPSEAEKMEDVSIDRGMEAFENGHPHSIRMGAI